MTRAVQIAELGDQNVFTIDSSNNRVGIGSTQPTNKLDVNDGAITVGTGITIDSVSGIISATGANVTGVVTAAKFIGPMEGTVTGNISGTSGGLSGSPDITITNLTGVAATFSGNVNISGTLTYEDVTNIDSVGIITAQSHVSIADSILHTGDTDTSIRFPAANTFTVETAGGEAIRVDAGRRLLVGTDSSANYGGVTGIFQIDGTTNASLALKRSTDNNSEPLFVLAKSRGTSDSPTVVNSGDGLGGIRFAGYDGSDYVTQGASIICAVDGTPGSNDLPGRLTFNTTADGASTPTERLRINSSGEVCINTTSTGSSAKFEVKSTTATINDATVRINGGDTTTGAVDTGSSLMLAGHDGGNVRNFASIFAGKENGTSGHYGAYLALGTRVNGSTVTEKLRVTSTGGVHFNNAELIERTNIVANKLSAVPNVSLDNGMVHYYTTNETTTANPNIISTAGINTNMATGDTMSVTILSKPNGAGYFPRISIDGLLTGITTYWSGGAAPSAAGSSGVDVNVYQIIKTGSATYDVLANTSNFA